MEIRTTPKPQVAALIKVRTTPVTVTGASGFVPGTRPMQRSEQPVSEDCSTPALRASIGDVVGVQLKAEIVRQKRVDQAKFAGVIGRARKILVRARAQKSPTDVERAIDEFDKCVLAAMQFDEKHRSRNDILLLIGTNALELEKLPLIVYTSVTVVPDPLLGSVTVPQSRYKLHKSEFPREVCGWIHLKGSDRDIEVIRLKGKRPTILPEPLRHISSSEQVDPPKARITYRSGDQFGAGPLLELPDDRHSFIGEIEGKPEKLMGAGQVAYMKMVEGCWVYYPYATDRKHCSDVPLIGSFVRGFKDPSQLKCGYLPIKTPCFTLIFEVCGKISAQLIGLNELGLVKAVEVPFSDDLVAGELVEITHGFEAIVQ